MRNNNVYKMIQITKSIRKRDGDVHKTKTICKNRTIKIYKSVQVHSNNKTYLREEEKGQKLITPARCGNLENCNRY